MTTPSHKTRSVLILIFITTTILLCIVFYYKGVVSLLFNIYYNPFVNPPLKESIYLPVNSDVVTTNRYKGGVTITVSGRGQIDSLTTHNAFTQFSADGSVNNFRGFTIDGNTVFFNVFLIPPTPINYATDQYRFWYPIGDIERQLRFRIENGNIDDKSVFTVEVTSRYLMDSPMR